MRLGDKVATMARRGAPLPYLRRVAYLESHGTEVVYIPELANYNPYRGEIEVDFEFYQKSIYESMFGGRITNSYSPGNENTFYPLKNPNATAAVFWYRDENGAEHSMSVGLVNSIRHKLKITRTTLTTDEVSYSYHQGLSLLDKPTIIGDFRLFVRHDNASASNSFPTSMKLWGFRAWVGGVLVCDFIPVLDFSVRPCLYNEAPSAVLATDPSRYFYNQGTGEFTWGELNTASNAPSQLGGGSKCLTPRRSYRRFSQPSARFHACTSTWEVAA